MSKKYWLKTSAHFFKDSHLVYLKSQKNGYEYIYLWQSLLLKCLEVDDEKDCGFLRLNEKIPYSPELLSEIFNLNIDIVRAGVDMFVNLGMMSILENGTLYIESVQKMIGRESESAERVRQHRERKLLHSNSDVTKSNPILNTNTNINTNKEIENNTADKSAPSIKKNFIKPSIPEINEYCLSANIKVDADRFFDFYESNGWSVGKNKMKDWKAACRNWSRNSFEKKEETPDERYFRVMGRHLKDIK